MGLRIDKIPYVIYYASHTLNEVQVNSTVIEKQFLTVILGFEKLKPYLIGSHVIVFMDIFKKKDVKPRLI